MERPYTWKYCVLNVKVNNVALENPCHVLEIRMIKTLWVYFIVVPLNLDALNLFT